MDTDTAKKLYANLGLDKILDDICVRFILHLPTEELRSVERLCFQVEEAHWYYEDFVRENYPNLPQVHLRNFIVMIFRHVPTDLISHLNLVTKAESAFADFMLYKTRVPVRGVIMLNVGMDKVVLVKGWKNGSSWSFPRGKIDQDEDDRDCAIRETYEETGYDLTGMVAEGDFVEINMREQNVKLYIAPGIPEDTYFETQTRKEISAIAWHNLCDLPGYPRKTKFSPPPGTRFYMVAPFMKEIRKWIGSKGKTWLESQQNAADTQQNQLSSAAINMAAIEDETEIEDEDLLPKSDAEAAEGLTSLLGAKKSAEVVQSGHMTEAEQEEASRRLKEMINGPRPNMVERSPETHMLNGVNGNATPLAASNGQTKELAPNAKTLLSILQSPPSQPPNPQLASTSQPPQPFHSQLPHLPSYGHTNMMQHMQSSQYGYSQQQLAPMPPNQRMQENSPSRQVPQMQQQIHRAPGYSMGPAPYHLPSPPPTSRFGFPPPPPMNNYQQGFQRQVPLTPVEPFQAPLVPSKPPDVGQTGALLSILKSNPPVVPIVTKPQEQPTPPPPSKTVTPAPANPQVLQQPGPRVSLQPPPPPKGPRSNIAQRRTNGPMRPATSEPQSHSLAPPPHRPGTTHPPTATFRVSTPTALDQYGKPKQPSPMATAKFDRRESVTGQQAQTLLAMFKNTSSGAHAEEAIASSPETPSRKPVIPAIERLSTPSGRRPQSPSGKDRDQLLAYLEGVAMSTTSSKR
ncbi:hypothetical protein EDC01DRAFT_10082 [Geopyxis carbonaria]|nr:hypothetical protein EDC01DRAFT_10082 [Geopyxis carbonaria]